MTKTTVIDKIEILEDGVIQVREAKRVFDDDGTFIGERLSRWTPKPGRMSAEKALVREDLRRCLDAGHGGGLSGGPSQRPPMSSCSDTAAKYGRGSLRPRHRHRPLADSARAGWCRRRLDGRRTTCARRKSIAGRVRHRRSDRLIASRTLARFRVRSTTRKGTARGRFGYYAPFHANKRPGFNL